MDDGNNCDQKVTLSTSSLKISLRNSELMKWIGLS